MSEPVLKYPNEVRTDEQKNLYLFEQLVTMCRDTNYVPPVVTDKKEPLTKNSRGENV